MAFGDSPTYPLTAPTYGVVDFNISMTARVVTSESPFTGAVQTYNLGAHYWSATVTLAPMKRENAVEWQTFFMKLKGRTGTFKMGSSDWATARGVWSSETNTAVISLADDHDAGVETIHINEPTSLSSSSTARVGLKKGDMIELQDKLYMVTDDFSYTYGSGIFNIQPPLKVTIDSNTSTANKTIKHNNAQGLWRLDDPSVRWDVDKMQNYGLSFTCSEAF
ncbi:MAG: hypothetical protein ACPGO7_00195 [Alphaproteobacteria bacterium]